MHELDEKLERLSRLCHAQRLGGILLSTQSNFAWVTGGRSNRIDGSREPGSAAILVTADSRRFLVANAIELPRLLGEVLAGIPCEPIEYPWVDGVAQPASIAQLARAVTAQGELGTDWALPGALLIDGAIAGARAPLTQEEIARYRALGADVGREIGALCRRLEPGVTEETIARCAADAVAAVGARAIVALVGADDRIARFRHPTPTGVPWRRLFMLVVCAERHGLVAAVTRLVSAGPVDPDIARRTSAAVSVLERLLEGTRPGVTGRDLYAVATSAYADLGFPGEERRHHQGGAIGYQAREWLAHPASEMRVESRQAFAWNPSITGTKVEDTALLVDDEMEMITGSPGWPSAEMRVGGRMLAAPLVLERT